MKQDRPEKPCSAAVPDMQRSRPQLRRIVALARRAGLLAVIGAVVLAALLPATAQAQQEAAGRPGTPFILSDHKGGIVTDRHLAGLFSLVYFGYTHCPDVCPTSLLTLADVMDRLGSDADKVQPLFVTVDPARDTVGVLREYVTNFHPRLVGLTGSAEMIERVARSWRIKFERVEGTGKDAYTVDHTASLLFLGPAGEIVTRFPQGKPASDIAMAVREAVASFKPPARALRR